MDDKERLLASLSGKYFQNLTCIALPAALLGGIEYSEEFAIQSLIRLLQMTADGLVETEKTDAKKPDIVFRLSALGVTRQMELFERELGLAAALVVASEQFTDIMLNSGGAHV